MNPVRNAALNVIDRFVIWADHREPNTILIGLVGAVVLVWTVFGVAAWWVLS